MTERPTPEDIERYLASERAKKLGSEAEGILEGGGSYESLELVDEILADMFSATRKFLVGEGGIRPITSEEIQRETTRALASGKNPYPRLTMAESFELQRLLTHSTYTPAEIKRSAYLQQKATGQI